MAAMVEPTGLLLGPVFESGGVRVWRIDGPRGERRGPRALREVRSVLGYAVGVDLTSGRVAVDERGKPHLAGAEHEDGAHRCFSVSHAPGVTLVAVARDRPVGIDIEAVVPDFDDVALVAGFFSEHERAQLEALPRAQRQRAFFACWVRKEAYLKATGEGLWGGLGHFDVSVGPDEQARLLAVHGHPGEAARWTLRTLDVGSGYVAALAVEGPVRAAV